MAQHHQVRVFQRNLASPPEVNVAGLILSGGESRRMGTAKALLTFSGETFLDRLIRIFKENCNSVTVVLGHDHTIQHRILRAGEATFVANPEYKRGQLSSLQCGLKSIPADADFVLFTPVDYPAIEPSTVQAMLDQAPGSLLVIPRLDERHGHPVLFAASLIDDFLSLPSDGEARTVIRRNIARTTYVDVKDPGILRDVDDPEAYAELLKATRTPK
ncbi:MAG: nucleotidyltransferase family protein [Bryobacteraceae bacterium]